MSLMQEGVRYGWCAYKLQDCNSPHVCGWVQASKALQEKP